MPDGPLVMRRGAYRTRTTRVSDIERGQDGRLVRLTGPPGLGSFLIAFEPKMAADELSLRGGWRAEDVGRDGMWLPEACAQKPSWWIDDRYLLINDARYVEAQVVDAYVVYDLVGRTFTYLTDPEAKKSPSKVLHVHGDTEGNIVFYLDLHDREGPYAADREYRHSRAHDRGHLVRRVISARDFSFTDYKVPFSTPGIENYTLRIFGQHPNLLLGVNDESRATVETSALVTGRELTLERGFYEAPLDEVGTRAMQAAEAAVASKRSGRTSTTRDENVNIAAREEDQVYLRVGANGVAASLPAVYDIDRRRVTLPIGDDFALAGFVVAAAGSVS